ncbi:MAG: hypothetical protein ACK4TO_02625 [Candidatus Nitrosotenuis sp.]
MRFLLVCFVVIFISGIGVPAQSSVLPRSEEFQNWYFGQGLTAGDEFVFEICDFSLRIPQSPSPCYVAILSYVTLLPSNQEQIWIVSVRVNHDASPHDMILHHTKTTHKMRTDVSNISYADSLQRTLGWISRFANEYKPQVLDVGKSWGTIASGAGQIHLIVNRVEQTDDEKEQTYVLGYELTKDSYLQIRPGFPFPLKAKVYKPVFLQEQPLSFAFQLLSYRSTLEMCNVGPSKMGDFSHNIVGEQESVAAIPNGTQTWGIYKDVQKIDEDIMRLLKERYGQRYMQEIEQAAHNFTKFIEMISEVMDSPDLNMTEPN